MVKLLHFVIYWQVVTQACYVFIIIMQCKLNQVADREALCMGPDRTMLCSYYRTLRYGIFICLLPK